MKITILTQYYPPEHGAPQNRLHDLAKRWVEAGEEVLVLTAMPNYPRGEVFEEYRGKLICTEEIDGVKVIHSAIFVSKKKSMITMLSIYFSFVFSSIIAGILKLRKSDVLLCESPPLFLGFSALILKFWTRSKLVTNISDLWPESAVQLGLIGKGPTLSALEFFERLLYKSSKLVSCQTDGIVEGVKKSHPKAETFLFPNGVDLEMFTPQDKDDSLKKEFELPDDHFIVGYGGNHGRSQALSQVLEAAARLKDEKIIFVLFGDGPEKPELQEKVKEMGLENVRFYPSQPRQKMSKIQSLWDLALAPLKNIEIFDGARPSKMFELMAGEIPFIFCGKGEGADIALESGSAKVAPPESYDDLAEAIRAFAKMTPEQRKEMGKQGRKFAAENFDRSKLAVKFLEKLKEVLKK